MTKDAKLKRKRLIKLDPRAHIGYLVGYDSTNIYRVWVPHQGKVISTRDVIFDEKTCFNGKKESLSEVLIQEKDDLVQKATMPQSLVENTQIVEDEDTIVVDTGDLEMAQEDDTIVVDTGHLEMGQGLHDSICRETGWPTPLELITEADPDDPLQEASFACLPVRDMANP